MDELKKHIAENRADLDKVEKPDVHKIWAGIQSKMAEENRAEKDTIIPISKKAAAPKQGKQFSQQSNIATQQPSNKATQQGKRFTIWTMAVAASVTLLIGLGIGYLLTPKVVQPATFNLANYAPELATTDQDYRQKVHQKMSEIDFQSIDTLAFTQILQELKELDGEYENWTKDVPQYIHEQELLDFLQRHYEQKIRILEILSKEIEKKVNYEEREIRL